LQKNLLDFVIRYTGLRFVERTTSNREGQWAWPLPEPPSRHHLAFDRPFGRLAAYGKVKIGYFRAVPKLIFIDEKIFLLFSIYGNNTHPLGLNKGQNIHVGTWRIDVDRSQ